ncbi:MAG: hypothetical protein HY901_11735, partial [Deltaproteobacteria bacterium]|nr:hypothetical protein [Deltaproteobacteria bacterium]
MRTRIAVVVAVLVILFVDIGGPAQCRACTAFLASTPEGHLVAKGFDWITGEGWIVWNERGRTRSLLFADGSPQDTWTSRYASLTLTTVGPGFPVSGMNEAGLAIEALVDLSGRPTSSAQPG